MKDMKKAISMVLVFIMLSMMIAFLPGCGGNPPENSGTVSETPPTASADEPTDKPIAELTPSESNPYIVVPESIPPDGFIDYQAVIEEYRRFAGYAIEFDKDYYRNVPDSDLWHNRGFMGGLVALANTYKSTPLSITKEEYGYAFKDLNGNGDCELILLLRDYTVLAVFSTVDGKPKLLDMFWPRHRCAIYDSGLLYTHSSGGAYNWADRIQQISPSGDELILLEEFGVDGYIEAEEKAYYYKLVDGEKLRISETELGEFRERYLGLTGGTVNEITKNSGIEFIPLFG